MSALFPFRWGSAPLPPASGGFRSVFMRQIGGLGSPSSTPTTRPHRAQYSGIEPAKRQKRKKLAAVTGQLASIESRRDACTGLGMVMVTGLGRAIETLCDQCIAYAACMVAGLVRAFETVRDRLVAMAAYRTDAEEALAMIAQAFRALADRIN